MGYTVRPMHILFRPCLTLNKRNDRQRSPTAIMQTNSSMCMRVRINVVGVALSIKDCRKRVSGRGLCEPFTKKQISRPAPIPGRDTGIKPQSGKYVNVSRMANRIQELPETLEDWNGLFTRHGLKNNLEKTKCCT